MLEPEVIQPGFAQPDVSQKRNPIADLLSTGEERTGYSTSLF
jgi:hypothetical protein